MPRPLAIAKLMKKLQLNGEIKIPNKEEFMGCPKSKKIVYENRDPIVD
jgi:hypothetical protein